MMRINKGFLSPQATQKQIEPEFMGISTHPLTSYGAALQNPTDNLLTATDASVINPLFVSQRYTFVPSKAEQQLNEIRQEAEEARLLDSEIDPIPESAYDDALSLLEVFFHFGVPMSELSWAEDGSLTLGWYPEEGTITIGVYGDDLVIFTAFFEEKRQFEGICALSDTPMLSGFLEVLTNILM